MMISTMIGKNKFNFRVSGIFIDSENKRFLTNTGEGFDFSVLPGGRVESGEPSDIALKREIQEELGEEIEIIALKSIIENFFNFKGVSVQELQFIYIAKFKDKKLESNQGRFKSVENKDYYEWVNFEDLDTLVYQPDFAKHIIKQVICGDYSFQRVSNFENFTKK